MYAKIDKLLQENGITAYRLSKDTGISESLISDWKNGKCNPKIDKVKVLADYFKVPISYFIG